MKGAICVNCVMMIKPTVREDQIKGQPDPALSHLSKGSSNGAGIPINWFCLTTVKININSQFLKLEKIFKILIIVSIL